MIIPNFSTEASPSAKWITQLIGNIRETGAKAIFLEVGVSPQVAEQIAKEADIKVVTEKEYPLPYKTNWRNFMKKIPLPVQASRGNGYRHMLSILKDYRKTAVILALGLITLTMLSCLPYAPQGPFDARDYTRIAGIRVEQHPWVALIEPLAAPFLILSGAPDFLRACIALLTWMLLGTAAWAMIAGLRAWKGKKPLAVVLKGVRGALVVSSTMVLIIFLFVVGRIPGWRLVVNAPDLIVADLHSHTTKSHDAIVSLRTNLQWHASCGHNLVGLTEHDQFFAHELDAPANPSIDWLPTFISGVEAHGGQRSMLLGLCQNSHVQFEKFEVAEYPDRAAWFAKKIHEECGGAVISLTLKRLASGDIARLTDDGVDAFEIVNSGHPEMRPDLRQEVLDTCRSRGIPLVATTDWHGWTGLARTWTLIKAPGMSALSHSQQANLVIRKLREHDSGDFIPVVAGYMGDPSLIRAIFSPIAETVRYSMELSTARIISWWVWVWAVFALWVFLERKGLQAGGILLDLVVSITAFGLIAAGLSQIREGIVGSVAPYPIHIGLVTVAFGAAVFGYSTIRWVGFLRRRHNLKATVNV